MEGAGVAEDGAGEVVAIGVAGITRVRGVLPGAAEKSGTLQIESAGAEQTCCGDVAEGGGVCFCTRVENLEGFENKGQILGADAVGFG